MVKSILSFIASLTIIFSISVFAEDDPNPNSPTPVLLSQTNSERVLAVESDAWKGTVPADSENVFQPDAKKSITLFFTNVELMPNEIGNAFRVYLFQKSGKTFELQVDELVPLDNSVYALKIRLYDPNGYRGQPKADGESLIYLSWRGLVSNALRISLGNSDGAIKYPKFLNPETPKSVEPTTSDAAGYLWSGDRTRFLEQAAFGPTAALDSRIRRIGLRIWLNEQFNAPYPTIPYPNPPLMPSIPEDTCSMSTFPSCYRQHYTMQPVQQWFFKEAFYGDAQLRHRVSWALSQIWVTSGVTVQQSSHMIAYHKVLSQNAFGNYRELMNQVTLNPTMGNYLDMARSTKNIPNENYAREILQLFNVGLYMLDAQGRVIINPTTNEPIPTYGQPEVNNFTSVLTGWNFCESGGGQCPNRALGAANFIDPMIISNVNNHDLSAKTLLTYPGSTTTNVAACTGCTGTQILTYAENSFNQALDNIYNHPNTAPFVSKYLIQQLVTGDPTPAYVGRVAAVFNANRTNPAQMKEVIRAILLDPEARGDLKTDPHYGKLREPVLYVTNIARHFDVRSADRSVLSDGVVTAETSAMEQAVFMAPSVFNFYAPEYIVPGTTFNGPEFALFTTGTSVNRINLGNTLVFNRININTERRVTLGTSISLSDMQAFAESDASGNRLMDALNIRLMHGSMSAQMRETILNAVLTVPATDPLLRAKRAVYLVITSSQYQVQK
jgi:uncharacterized protein (DUF1800 family)